MSMVNIRHLRAFVAVAEHRHFTNAAEAIHVSQPALSALIRQLEDDLGVKLLERDTRNVDLTRIGREFHEIALKTLTTFDDALTHVADYGALKKGRVTIAALPSIASSLLPKLLHDFSARNPGIQVGVRDVPGDQVIDMIQTRQADLGLTHSQPGPEFVNHPVLTDRLALVGQLQHARPKGKSIRWKALGSEPIIAMIRGTTIRALIDAAAASAKTSLNIVLEPRLLPTAIAFAEEGFGSAILPTSILPLRSLKKCRQYDLIAPSMSREVSLIRLSNHQLQPAAKALYEHLVASMRD